MKRSSRSSARPKGARRERAWGWRSAGGSPGPWAATSRSKANRAAAARFLLTLPLDSRSAEASVGTTELGERSDGELVLLSIDDDPSVSPLLQKMLGDQGYRVVGSTDPSRAASDARSLMPAAILLDLLMPGRDGRDILRRAEE